MICYQCLRYKNCTIIWTYDDDGSEYLEPLCDTCFEELEEENADG